MTDFHSVPPSTLPLARRGGEGGHNGYDEQINRVFSWGHMAYMVPSPVLIGVVGPKATIEGGVLAWSAAQMLSPTAASTSLSTLLACRFMMGVGEAVTVPSIQVCLSRPAQNSEMARLPILHYNAFDAWLIYSSPWKAMHFDTEIRGRTNCTRSRLQKFIRREMNKHDSLDYN